MQNKQIQHQGTTGQMGSRWVTTRIVSTRISDVVRVGFDCMMGFVTQSSHRSNTYTLQPAPELRAKYGAPGATDADGFNPYEDSVGPGTCVYLGRCVGDLESGLSSSTGSLTINAHGR